MAIARECGFGRAVPVHRNPTVGSTLAFADEGPIELEVQDPGQIHRKTPAGVLTSGAFCAATERWAARGLQVYHLPPYSPELNLIECFWKKLKYQLLPVGAWECFTTLLSNATTALCSIGQATYLPSLEGYAE